MFTISFVENESFPVQKSGGMILLLEKTGKDTPFTLNHWAREKL
jgi:hypothetical protein